MCVVCHPTRLPFRSAFSPPPSVGMPPDCCFVAIRRSAAVRGVCPFLLPAAGSFPARCTPEHSSFLFRKKRASVAPGPSRTGKGAAAAYRRQCSFGGNGPSAAAAIRWLRPCGDCVAVRPVHLLFRAGAKRDGRAADVCAHTTVFVRRAQKKRSDASRRRASLVRLVRLMRVGEPHVCYTKINRFLGKTKYFVTFLRVDESFSDRL